jgi:protein gp37
LVGRYIGKWRPTIFKKKKIMFKTYIQWSDYTHNFWNGCHKVSDGCKFCYMYRMTEGKGYSADYVWRASNTKFNSPLYMKDGQKIFTCSMSDFFIEEADQWRADAWKVIKDTPQHTWQILTKRPENISDRLPADWGEGYKNVWLGVTVESQKHFYRAETLANIPARTRFLSVEPLLEEMNLLVTDEDDDRIIDHYHQVIIGGESGNEIGKYRYRPCEPAWIRRIIQDLKNNTNVPVFVKQMGSYIRKIKSLKQPHGGDMNEWPKEFRIREWPKAS